VTDLAVVKINAGGDLPVAPLGNSRAVRGDWGSQLATPGI